MKCLFLFALSHSLSLCLIVDSWRLVCKWIDAASVSGSYEAEDNAQSSKATTVMDFLKVKQTKRDSRLTDRNRRLIPYMMVYIPTTIRQLAPFANAYGAKQMVSARRQFETTLPTMLFPVTNRKPSALTFRPAPTTDHAPPTGEAVLLQG